MIRKDRGFTLMELLVAITISMVFVVVMSAAYEGSRQSNRVTNGAQQLQEQGRQVISFLGRYIQMAGYTPYVDISLSSGVNKWDVPSYGSAIQGCDGGYLVPSSLDPKNLINSTCRVDSVRPDALTLAYRTNEPVQAGNDILGEGQDCLRQKVTTISAANTDLIVNRFFLQQRVYTENGIQKTVGELSCVGSGSPTVSQPIFSGVQDLQILYGVAAAGSQVPQQYFPANLVTDWEQVIALRVCVLMRTVDSSITGDARTYQDCQGNTITPPGTDTYLYRSFNGVYVLRNRVTDFLAGQG